MLATTDHGFTAHRVLERWPTEPTARQALERAANHDADPDVRAVARRGLRKT